MDILGSKANSYGIATLYNGATALGSVDAYNSTSLTNVVLSISGIALTGTSPFDLKLKVESKNASSSNYNFSATVIKLVRTGS